MRKNVFILIVSSIKLETVRVLIEIILNIHSF